jgi:hypothetical protein
LCYFRFGERVVNLKDKLKGLPTIYYVNLDNRTDRKEYMESQFNYWGIKNSYSTACYMINKNYAKKLKEIMLINEKYKLSLYDGSYEKNMNKKYLIIIYLMWALLILYHCFN